jgi:hypothetical protein
MCGCEKKKKSHLRFKFSKNDSEFKSTNIIVDNSTTNNISTSFVKAPIYSLKNKQIGYKVSHDIVQQVGENKYVVTLNNTYAFTSKGVYVGSISWKYVFINTTNSVFYPVNVPAKSTIISGTGVFSKAKGKVTLMAKPNGDRFVDIKFE